MQSKKYHLLAIRKRKRRILLSTVGLMTTALLSFIAVFHGPIRAALFNGSPARLSLGIGFLLVGLSTFLALTSFARQR